MSNKKYYITCKNENGDVIFNSKSDSAKALLKRYEKAAYFSDGNMCSEFYFGTFESNITDEIKYRIHCGENI